MKRIIINLVYLLISFLLYYLLVKYVIIRYLPFFMSIIIVLSLMNILNKKLFINKGIGFVILLMLYVLISILMILVIYNSIDSLYKLLLNSRDYYDLYIIPSISYLMNLLEPYNLDSILIYGEKMVDSIFVFFIDHSLNILSFIPSYFSFYFLMIVSSFLFYFSYEDIRKYLYKIFSIKQITYLHFFKNNIMKALKNHIYTQLQLIVVIFVILTIAFMILRFKSAIILAFIIALLDAFPFIGVGICLIPMTVFYIIINNYSHAVYLFVLYLLINMIRTYLETYLMKNKMKIPSFILFISFIVHIQLFGVIGIFISPILLTLIQSILDNYY